MDPIALRERLRAQKAAVAAAAATAEADTLRAKSEAARGAAVHEEAKSATRTLVLLGYNFDDILNHAAAEISEAHLAAMFREIGVRRRRSPRAHDLVFGAARFLDRPEDMVIDMDSENDIESDSEMSDASEEAETETEIRRTPKQGRSASFRETRDSIIDYGFIDLRDEEGAADDSVMILDVAPSHGPVGFASGLPSSAPPSAPSNGSIEIIEEIRRDENIANGNAGSVQETVEGPEPEAAPEAAPESMSVDEPPSEPMFLPSESNRIESDNIIEPGNKAFYDSSGPIRPDYSVVEDPAEEFEDAVEYPVEHSVQSIEHSVQSIEHPVEHIEKPVEAVEEPLEAAEVSAEPVEEPVEPVRVPEPTPDPTPEPTPEPIPEPKHEFVESQDDPMGEAASEASDSSANSGGTGDVEHVQKLIQEVRDRAARLRAVRKNTRLREIALKRTKLTQARQLLDIGGATRRVAKLEAQLVDAKAQMLRAAQQFKVLDAEARQLDRDARDVNAAAEAEAAAAAATAASQDNAAAASAATGENQEGAATTGAEGQDGVSRAGSPDAPTTDAPTTDTAADAATDSADSEDASSELDSAWHVERSPLRMFSAFRMCPALRPTFWFAPTFNARFVPSLPERAFCSSELRRGACARSRCPDVHFHDFEVDEAVVCQYMASRELDEPEFRAGLVDAVEQRLHGDVPAANLAATIIGFRRSRDPTQFLDWNGRRPF